ncbi:IS21 family transposase, partial [Massilia sp. CCM 8692]|nr:IS21 family transposase [Massilia rubra]
FNGYLRRSFYVPLASLLAQSGQKLDVVTANVEVAHWLAEVANARVHGTTKEPPASALKREAQHLQALPAPWRGDIAAARPLPATVAPTPPRPAAVISRIAQPSPAQHPLHVYDALLVINRAGEGVAA